MKLVAPGDSVNFPLRPPRGSANTLVAVEGPVTVERLPDRIILHTSIRTGGTAILRVEYQDAEGKFIRGESLVLRIIPPEELSGRVAKERTVEVNTKR